MSEYRRFISYIYEYRKGRKENNCGYAKVEIRNGVCRLRVHLQRGARVQNVLKVYGFVQEEGRPLGIYLGNAGVRNQVCEFQASSPAAELANSGYGINDMRGIWLRGAEEENYITVWDDEPVMVEQFMAKEDVPIQESAKEPVEEAEREPEQESAEEDIQEPAEESAEEDIQEPAGELNAETVQEPPKELTEEIVQEAAESPIEEAGQDVEAMQENLSTSLANRWERFLNHYPQIQPFADDEITQCICIALKDLSFLNREEWHFSKSPFVRQAYMRYHHLMLGCHVSGRFVLAVPGMNHVQEGHMARMSGFAYFKEAVFAQDANYEVHAAAERNAVQPAGYWYHFLNEVCP